MSGKEAVKVIVRCRPMNKRENDLRVLSKLDPPPLELFQAKISPRQAGFNLNK